MMTEDAVWQLGLPGGQYSRLRCVRRTRSSGNMSYVTPTHAYLRQHRVARQHRHDALRDDYASPAAKADAHLHGRVYELNV